MPRFRLALPVLLIAAMPTPAHAVDVSLSALVINLCVLTPATGTLGSETDGTTLSTEGVGGIPATVAVVATGNTPTLLLTAPTLTTPAGFAGTPTTTIQASNAGGILAAYTSGPSSTGPLNRLLDTVTVRARVVNSTGFASGIYTVRTTVTCQQN